MKSQSTKDRIRMTAVTMFAEKGYHGTTTSEIARMAGVSEGTIFKYYPKKKELLKQVAVEIVDLFANRAAVEGVEKILTDSEEMGAEDFLEAIIRERLNLFNQYNASLKVLIIEMQFHEVVREAFREKFLRNMLITGKRIIAVVRDKTEVGEYSDEDLMRGLLGMISGILLQKQLLGPMTQDMDTVVQNSIKIYMNGIRRNRHE